MSAAKQSAHTSGPWHFEESELTIVRGIITPEEVPAYRVSDAKDTQIGYLTLNKRAPQFLANARLIASAPDLLAALKSLHSRFTKYPKPPTGKDLEIYMNEAAAAIAAAEGRAQ